MFTKLSEIINLLFYLFFVCCMLLQLLFTVQVFLTFHIKTITFTSDLAFIFKIDNFIYFIRPSFVRPMRM